MLAASCNLARMSMALDDAWGHYRAAVQYMAKDPKRITERVFHAINEHVMLVVGPELPRGVQERHQALVALATTTTKVFDPVIGKLAAAFEEIGEDQATKMAEEIVEIEDALSYQRSRSSRPTGP